MGYEPIMINGYDVNHSNIKKWDFPLKIYNFISSINEFYELKGGRVIPIKTRRPDYTNSSNTEWRQLIINSFNQNNEYATPTSSDINRIASNYLTQKANYNNYNFMDFKEDKLYGIHCHSYLYYSTPQGLNKKRADTYLNNTGSSNSLVLFIVKSIKDSVLLTGEKVKVVDTYCPHQLDYFHYFYSD